MWRIVASEHINASLYEVEWEWSIDDVDAAHTVLDAMEEMQPEPPKPARGAGGKRGRR